MSETAKENTGKITFSGTETITLTLPRFLTVTWPGVKEGKMLDIGAFDSRIVAYGFAHGVKQKCGDQFGGKTDPTEREALIVESLARLLEGEWNRKRGDYTSRLSESFEAFLCTREGLTGDATKWIKANPKARLETTNSDHVAKIVGKLAAHPVYAEKVANLRAVYDAKVALTQGGTLENLDLAFEEEALNEL